MTLTDTGPLVALLHRRDPHHVRCVELTDQFPPGPLLTTWPCLTEAMYLLHRVDGSHGQDLLWELVAREMVQLAEITWTIMFRMQDLMERYRNVPMDLADASLVAVAESRGIKQLFTLDSDFRIYRLADSTALEVIS